MPVFFSQRQGDERRGTVGTVVRKRWGAVGHRCESALPLQCKMGEGGSEKEGMSKNGSACKSGWTGLPGLMLVYCFLCRTPSSVRKGPGCQAGFAVGAPLSVCNCRTKLYLHIHGCCCAFEQRLQHTCTPQCRLHVCSCSVSKSRSSGRNSTRFASSLQMALAGIFIK